MLVIGKSNQNMQSHQSLIKTATDIIWNIYLE